MDVNKIRDYVIGFLVSILSNWMVWVGYKTIQELDCAKYNEYAKTNVLHSVAFQISNYWSYASVWFFPLLVVYSFIFICTIQMDFNEDRYKYISTYVVNPIASGILGYAVMIFAILAL